MMSLNEILLHVADNPNVTIGIRRICRFNTIEYERIHSSFIFSAVTEENTQEYIVDIIAP